MVLNFSDQFFLAGLSGKMKILKFTHKKAHFVIILAIQGQL